MHRAHSLRFILVAALFFAFGTVHVGMAASTAFDQQLHRQDIGDDDGDGILNYLDPDDNNDAVQDKDTPAPTTVPDPPVDETEEEIPDPDTAVDDATNPEQTPDPATTPDEPTDTPEQSIVETPVAEAPVAQQVTTLPDTGAGLDDSSRPWTAFVILALFVTGIMAVDLKSKNRVS